MKVAVVMGSLSDMNKVEPMIEVLKNYEVEVLVKCLSAHRAHDKLVEFVRDAENLEVEVIIAAAGKAAHLAGVLAGNTTLPVIGIPVKASVLDGMDALLATVQMPSGIPVATVAIDGSANAAILAAQILALSDENLASELKKMREKMTSDVVEKDKKIKAQFE